MTYTRRLLVLAACALLFAPRAADACSCIGGIPLCEIFWKTPVVFEGEVLDIQYIPNPSGATYPQNRSVRFTVGRVFRGEVPATVDVTTGSGGGDCGYNFIRGVRYMVYAHQNVRGLSTGICSRTRPIGDATEDLEYFKALATTPAAARVFGRASFQRRSYGDPDVPAAGYRVVLKRGQTERVVETNADGKYEFTNVQPGTYDIQLVVPDTEHVYGGTNYPGSSPSVTVVDPRACAGADFTLVPNGRITIRVVDAARRPAPGLTLEAREVDARDFQAKSGETDENGVVTFAPLPPGRYVIGINTRMVAVPKQPYATTYFPAANDPSQAHVIEVGRGARRDAGTFVLPAPLTRRQLTGIIRWPDGTPAAGVNVSVVGAGTSWVTGSGSTGTDGRFAIDVYDGVTYRVSASITTPAPERATSQASVDRVTAREGLDSIELVLRRIR